MEYNLAARCAVPWTQIDDSVRSASERIFQCAMMDYADNAGLHDDYENSDPKDAARGLSVYEQRHGLEGLFGREFHLWGLGGYVHRDMVDVLKDAMPTPPIHTIASRPI